MCTMELNAKCCRIPYEYKKAHGHISMYRIEIIEIEKEISIYRIDNFFKQ